MGKPRRDLSEVVASAVVSHDAPTPEPVFPRLEQEPAGIDDEVQIMQHLVELFDGVHVDKRTRVLAWANARFTVADTQAARLLRGEA